MIGVDLLSWKNIECTVVISPKEDTASAVVPEEGSIRIDNANKNIFCFSKPSANTFIPRPPTQIINMTRFEIFSPAHWKASAGRPVCCNLPLPQGQGAGGSAVLASWRQQAWDTSRHCYPVRAPRVGGESGQTEFLISPPFYDQSVRNL